MSEAGFAQGMPAARILRSAGWVAACVGIVAIAGVVAVALWSNRTAQAQARPAETSVEAGFARDMSVHHAQAVEMAELIRTRTRSPEIRQLAVDISLTQQAQQGQMRGWLDVWGLRPVSSGPAMAWMDMPTSGAMPGMASRTQLNDLASARGERADALFLGLMLDHHEAGVTMAREAVERSMERVVDQLAGAIAQSQTTERRLMERLLAELDGPRGAPEDAQDSNHEGEH